MKAEEKLWAIIQRVHSMTMRGELTWERTPTATRFQAAFPQYVVRITETWPEEGIEPDYWFAVYNETGQEVETINDSYLTRALPKAKGTIYSTMRELFKHARRSALGVDAALDQLLATLPPEQPDATSENAETHLSDNDAPF